MTLESGYAQRDKQRNSPRRERKEHVVRIGTIVVAGALVGVAGVIGLRAAQGPPAQGAAARPLVPMTASTIAREPAAHLGENVSMMAAVETVLSKTIFTVDQDKSKATGREVIVIAPTLTAAPDVNTYLTIQGEVMRFDPAEIAKKARNYTVDLPPDVIEKYRGRPAVLATAIVTPGLVDLAKRPIPPMTPDEVALSATMKTVNSAMGVVRAGLEKPDAAQLKDQTAALTKSFTEARAVFKTRGMTSAVVLAEQALKFSTTMEQGVAAGKWDDVKAAAGGLQPLCAQCHGEHRERMDDGSYRIKGG
jgi:cytochrome c556